ncbi:right-handed parallel beta-helix repeat-containing protein [Alloacidobacterium dinghuense]|uniref:Right-handed parallel beta-helix repeat-containing protein n=1 Tax=Alloacidobacterium dinghuense TaxID=2763107 RepID=A0A7G8BDY0_9BACT|nr:right-handed parallel beta-helix repeat-containing protein [Alloacidobacterium dinghuense]QNI30750.1 right-handed parallel beta-helix repeat-containing protein [Alloacidobacterium dinghuense]
MSSFKYIFLATLFSAAALSMAQSAVPSVNQRVFYLDCMAAQSGDGSSGQSAWNSLDLLQKRSFNPGDTIYIRRGSECHGRLAPQGSGSMHAPIRITAYGEGARPKIIAAATSEESFRLFNQEYWEIDSLDFSGGRTYGIFISGDKGILHHIHLKNLAVHDVLGGEMKSKDNGLVLITPGSADQRFDDVLVDGVTAWNTHEWMGIMIGGGRFGYPPESSWSTNVVIRNSTVHDVQGDGIVLFRGRAGKIESSVAWNTGMQITETTGTPNAIWTWMCDDCTVSQNEAFLTDSPGVDGGAFDIDYGNTKNSVIDNYGHDTQGYCVAVFGAGFITRESVVRGNVCVNNGRSPRMANYQGAIFLLTWNGGSIDGLTVENNTVYWSPYEKAPALLNDAQIATGTGVFRNNKIYSTSPWLTRSNSLLAFDANQYAYFGESRPEWTWNGQGFRSLTQMQQSVQQEKESKFDQRPFAQWSSVFQRTIPQAPDTRIFDQRFTDDAGHPFAITREDKSWRLYCWLPVSFDENGLINDEALKQIVFLKSLDQQYRARGLQTTLLLTPPSSISVASSVMHNAISDLDLKGMPVAYAVRNSDTDQAYTILVSPKGEVIQQWEGFAGPAELGLAARSWLGEPAYSQMGVNAND